MRRSYTGAAFGLDEVIPKPDKKAEGKNRVWNTAQEPCLFKLRQRREEGASGRRREIGSPEGRGEEGGGGSYHIRTRGSRDLFQL